MRLAFAGVIVAVSPIAGIVSASILQVSAGLKPTDLASSLFVLVVVAFCVAGFLLAGLIGDHS